MSQSVHAVFTCGGVLSRLLAFGMTPTAASAGFQWSSFSDVRQTWPPLGPLKIRRLGTGWPFARIHGNVTSTGGKRSM